MNSSEWGAGCEINHDQEKSRTVPLTNNSVAKFRFCFIKVRFEGVAASGVVVYNVIIKTVTCDLQPAFAKPGESNRGAWNAISLKYPLRLSSLATQANL